MHTSLVLVEGKSVDDQSLMISLANAKQIVIGQAPGYGHVLHIAATTRPDLDDALHEIAAVENVTGVITLATRVDQ
jgi:hypothetical protein